MFFIVGFPKGHHLILCFLCITAACAMGCQKIVIVILSQANRYHLQMAENLKSNILQQAEELYQAYPIVHLSHIDFVHVGGWTILPLIPRLSKLHSGNSSWIVFLEDRTHVNLERLRQTLDAYNHNEDVWLGYALFDHEPTIIHHFAFHEDPRHFKYPNIASGFAISNSLLKRLAIRVKHSAPANIDFSIDNAHELALFIWNQGSGPALHHEPALCITNTTHCATYPEPFHACGEPAEESSIYFAVKTCKKFHKDRVPVVKRTWAKHASRVNFFSDTYDSTIPTISLGIPNTENGHCGKTTGILKYVAKEIKNIPEIRWIIVVDDDTIMSVYRLQQLLSCYDPSEPVALGERYGYNVYNSHGYNYLTGGGGMVLSRALLQQLTLPGKCECPSLSSPDDMFLGLCVAKMGLEVTHSPLFHQARPVDYAPEYLNTKDAVSFHKHWMIDPVKVYKEWFLEDDLKRIGSNVIHDRTEL